MQIIVSPGKISYLSDSGDWRLNISDLEFEIVPIATGILSYASGVNLDNLSNLIVEAKPDAVQRGINWSGS